MTAAALLRGGLLLGAAGALLLLPAATAAAQDTDTGWVIESFEALIEVAADGTVTVTEDISVDFQGLQRHGIFRVIPARAALSRDEERALVPDGVDPADVLRAIDISAIRVSSTAPSDTDITRPNRLGERNVRIRIGDPDVTVTGPQGYRLRYEVRGAMTSFDGVDELYWNVTGDEWPVPIRRARAVVQGQPVTQAACYQGPAGSTEPCEELAMTAPASSVGYASRTLGPGEGMTVAVGFAPGAVEVAPPLLVEQWGLRRSLVGSAAAVPFTALTALLGLGGVGMLAYRQGRDRVIRGGLTVDGRPDEGEGAEHRRRSLFSSRAVPVRYRPPEELRPGQLGVLVDERVDSVDISATLVDFAVRGYLTIEETSSGRIRKRKDWTLVRTDRSDGDLLEYERTLLAGLFTTGSRVKTSALTGSFSSSYKRTSNQLYADAVARGWFPRNPEKTRALWFGLGIVAVAAAVGLLVAASLYTTMALAAVPLVVAACALVVAHRWMPHRTAKGSRLLAETLGFREFIATAEAGRMEFAEQENLFETYLPYAVVFGAVDRWAAAFAHLGVAATSGVGAWYLSPSGSRDLSSLSKGLSSFSSTVGSGLATTPSSSGSGGGGSSGGGSGGGGGGSW